MMHMELESGHWKKFSEINYPPLKIVIRELRTKSKKRG